MQQRCSFESLNEPDRKLQSKDCLSQEACTGQNMHTLVFLFLCVIGSCRGRVVDSNTATNPEDATTTGCQWLVLLITGPQREI